MIITQGVCVVVVKEGVHLEGVSDMAQGLGNTDRQAFVGAAVCSVRISAMVSGGQEEARRNERIGPVESCQHERIRFLKIEVKLDWYFL